MYLFAIYDCISTLWIFIYNTISIVRIISTHLRCQPSRGGVQKVPVPVKSFALQIAKVVTWRLASCSHVLLISWHFQDSGKGTFFFLWDQNWWDFFLNKVDTFFMFFSCCFSVVVLLCSPQWLGSFFLGCVWEGVLFVTFWMIQTPCVSSKKTTGGNARHPFQRRIRTISNGSDLCIPSGVGELSANEAMKPSQQNSKMDDDWCMMYIYIYIYTLLGTKKIPEEMTFD